MLHDDGLMSIGQSIKSLGNNRIGGYLVAWGKPGDTDLTNEYFTADTDFMLDRFPIAGQALVLYHHAMDDAAKGYELGTFDTATVDDYGLWAEAQLEVAEKYKRDPRVRAKLENLILKIKALVERQALGWSSGTAPQLVERDGGHIRRWPIVEGSLTPSPAQPGKTRIQAIKALTAADTLESLLVIEGEDGTDARELEPAHKTVSDRQDKEATMAAIKNSSAIIEAVMAEFPEITAEQVVRLTAAIEGSYAPMVEAVNAAEPEELAVEEELFDEEKATPTQKTAAEFAQIVARFARQELKSAAIKPFKGYGKRATNDPYANGAKAQAAANTNGETMNNQKSAPWANNGAPVEIENLALKSAFGHLDPRDISAALDLERLVNESGRRVAWNSPAAKGILVQTWAAHALEMARAGKLHLDFYGAQKAAAIKSMKADELDNTGQTGYGPEYVHTNWRDQLWETARADNVVLPNFVQFEMDAEVIKRPIRSTRGTVYHPIEPIDLADGDFSGGTITTSKLGTAVKTWTAQELAVSIPFSTRLDQDSIIPFAQFVRATATADLSRSVDHVLIQGDNATSANINYDGDTTPTTADYTVFDATWLDGLANGVDAGGDAVTIDDVEALRRKMSIEIVSVEDMVFFTDPYMESRLRLMDAFISASSYGGPAPVRTGEIGTLGGIRVLRTPVMLKTASDGKITYNAAGTLSRLLLVHMPSYELGWRRRMDVYLGTSPDGRAQLLTVNARLDLQNNALTGRAAGLYNALA